MNDFSVNFLKMIKSIRFFVRYANQKCHFFDVTQKLSLAKLDPESIKIMPRT